MAKTQLETGLLGYAERPWRRAPDDVGGSGDIYRASAEERAGVVRFAREKGVTLFHAAHEREAVSLGASLRSLGMCDGLLLSTTDGDALSRCPDTEVGGYDAVSRAVVRKLELLGVERLDMFHLYDVRREVHTLSRLAGAGRALTEARARGVVGFVGATCYGDYDYLANVIEGQEFVPDCVAARFSFFDQRAAARLLPVCAAGGIRTLAAQTFGWLGGVPFVRFPNTWRLRNMTQSFRGYSVAKAHLRWALGQAGVGGVLVSMQDAGQVRENADAVRMAMPGADMASVFAGFVDALGDGEGGWRALLQDPEWEIQAAAQAFLASLEGVGGE